MPLAQCPHMAARCPHYKADCLDPDSKHCLYVKMTTRSAASLLQNLVSSRQVISGPAPDLDKHIKEVQDFLDGKMDPP